jgi:tetratricopeptide (TPR) repeat protein
MAKQAEAARRFPDATRMLTTKLSIALYQGQVARAKELAAQYASESVSALGLKGSAASIWSNVAQHAAAFGDVATARAASRSSLDLERNVDTLLNGAFAMVVCGDAATARTLVDEAAKMPGAATEDAQRGFKLVEGLIRWRQGDKTAAAALPQPKDNSNTGLTFALGVVLLDEGRTEAAATRFKQIVDGNDTSLNALQQIAPVYYGRALAKLGKIDESRKAYEAFFNNWQKADADVPILVEAKKEYARLRVP